MGFLGALLGAAPTVLAGVAKGKRDREETEYTRDQAAMKQMAEENARQQIMAAQQFDRDTATTRYNQTQAYTAGRDRLGDARLVAGDILARNKVAYDANEDILDRKLKYDTLDNNLKTARMRASSADGLKIPVGAQNDAMTNVNAVTQLNYAIGRFDEVADRYMGDMTQVPGFGITNMFGAQKLKNVMDWTTPEERELRGLVSDIASMKILKRSGATVPAAEFEKLEGFVPNMSDPPEEIYRKLKGFRKIAQEELDAYNRQFSTESGYRGGLTVEPKPFAPTPPKPGGSVQEMLDAMRENPTP